MKTLTAEFQTRRDSETARNVIRRVKLIALNDRSENDITAYVKEDYDESGGISNVHISEITKRIEAGLNEFLPSEVSVEVSDEDIFFKSDDSGLFDPDQLSGGYQLTIEVGFDDLDGAPEYILMFDGKVDPDTIFRRERETVEFTAHSWLKNAERFNAEEIADAGNPPLKNITGVTVWQTPGYTGGYTGAKTLVCGSDTGKFLQYGGGEKHYFASNETEVRLWDATRENYITVNVVFNSLPYGNETDNFTVIRYDDYLRPCYWYEHKTLKFIVGKVYDKLGITTQDINVNEINSGTEKEFMYFNKFFTAYTGSNSKITAQKVVDYNAETDVIQMLFWVEVAKGDRNCLYHIEFDIENKTHTTTLLKYEAAYRGLKFLYFNGRTWTITGKEIGDFDLITSGNDVRWGAKHLYELAADWKSITHEETLSEDYPDPDPDSDDDWHFHLGYSATDYHDYQTMYIMQQKKVGGTYSLIWREFNGSTHNWVDKKTLEIGGDTALVADDYADGMYNTAGHFWYVYGARRISGIHVLQIYAYDLDNDDFEPIQGWSGVNYKLVWSKNTFDPSTTYKLYMKYYNGSAYVNFWVHNDGTYTQITNNNIQYAGFNRQKNKFFSCWFKDSYDFYYIARMKASTGSMYNFVELKKIDPDYTTEITAPKIYKYVDDYDCYFAGLCIDSRDNGIIPYIYAPNVQSTIKEANFTGMNCRQGLAKLAEGYLCVVDIYEKTKARFYYRETELGSDSIDTSDYLEQPQVPYWENWYDGVIVENTKYNLRWRYGSTDFDSRVLHIDNPFISEGTGAIVAKWLYNFFNQFKKFPRVDGSFHIESELIDKMALTLRDKDGNSFWAFNSLVYETSFDPSTNIMHLQLLEIQGSTVHETIIIPMGNKFIAN